ncbi:hypothetical protein C0J52_07205 [Blattella germanica]|nr:hypothetical protein C0J52_07205 [Blattella germanica]
MDGARINLEADGAPLSSRPATQKRKVSEKKDTVSVEFKFLTVWSAITIMITVPISISSPYESQDSDASNLGKSPKVS